MYAIRSYYDETKAIKSVFKEKASSIAVSSTKSMTGHLLGGAGGIETVFTALTISDGIIPPTINLDHPDEECDLDYVPVITSYSIHYTKLYETKKDRSVKSLSLAEPVGDSQDCYAVFLWAGVTLALFFGKGNHTVEKERAARALPYKDNPRNNFV